MALQRGRLHFAFEVAAGGIEAVERSGALPPISQAVYGELGEIYYQWHELELAHKHFQRAIHVARLSGFSDAQLYYDVILSRLNQTEGNLPGAAERLESAVALMKAEAPAAVREEVVAQQVRVYLAQGRLVDAEMALARFGRGATVAESATGLELEETISYSSGLLVISALRVCLYRGRVLADVAGLERGIKLADQLVTRSLDGQQVPIALKALVLRGQMVAARGDDGAGLADVSRAIELAEPEGAVSIFVEEGQPIATALVKLAEHGRLDPVHANYVRRILAAFARPAQAPVPPSAQSRPAAGDRFAAAAEPLTERELDVLRLMVEGLKYREIAERLFVSMNTVRSHVKAIYGKLGVDNRTRAIALAREQNLI